MKKVFAIILALVMVIAALPVSACAEQEEAFDVRTYITIDGKDAWGGFEGKWHFTSWRGDPINPKIKIWQEYEKINDQGQTEKVVKRLVRDKDYTLKLGNNKDAGYCKVYITGIGDYDGVDIVKKARNTLLANTTHEDYLYAKKYGLTKGPIFVIRPGDTKLLNAKPQKKAIKVTWRCADEKMSKKRIAGYQVQLSPRKDFKKGTTRTVTVEGYKNTAKTVKKLKGNKLYYVRLRTYFVCKDGFKSYSQWSIIKSAKTKK